MGAQGRRNAASTSGSSRTSDLHAKLVTASSAPVGLGMAAVAFIVARPAFATIRNVVPTFIAGASR